VAEALIDGSWSPALKPGNEAAQTISATGETNIDFYQMHLDHLPAMFLDVGGIV